MRSVSSSGPALAQSPAALPGTASPLAHAGELERLFVIVPDRLSALVSKGEVTQRYYNPGNLFREVHLFMTNDDRPDPAGVQPMVGDARLAIHNLPADTGTFVRSLGWRPALLRQWAAPAVQFAETQRPDLIRCHGNNLNAFAALEIKRALGVPYAISLHGNPDVDYNRGRLGRTWQRKLAGIAIESVEIAAVKNADVVLPVYSPIVGYLKKHAVEHYEVVYNVVDCSHAIKTSYGIGDRVKAICVGRQESLQKDPSPIIEAVAQVPRIDLTLIGDGDLHDGLRALAERLGVSGRVRFIRRMPNAQVLNEISAADIYVYCSDNWEISKTCIEASLMGLPIVLNKRRGGLADELIGDHVLAVEQSAQSYRECLERLVADESARAHLGRQAAGIAHQRWHPAIMEARYVDIYRGLVNRNVKMQGEAGLGRSAPAARTA
jgi:glycosyltransferase involved in cell wall biosynthesis